VKTKTKKPGALWIAVIAGSSYTPPDAGLILSARGKWGDWSSFLGAKTAVIEQAIQARAEWEAKGSGPYVILLGTITEKVQLPTNFKVVKLKGGKL
jgi:hypothetical protein